MIKIKELYPIIEFDDSQEVYIRPEMMQQPVKNMPQNCIICFFEKSLKDIINQYDGKVIAHFTTFHLDFPVYKLNFNGTNIAIVAATAGGALAVAQIEELSAMGAKNFIAIGSCGGMMNVKKGEFVIPIRAIRDEGASYHYISPSREIKMNDEVVKIIENQFKEQNIQYKKVKTWTTDAIYRETYSKVENRKKEGCEVVEMECASYMAVCQYKGLNFGQICYISDTLNDELWDGKDDFNIQRTQDELIEIALRVSERIKL